MPCLGSHSFSFLITVHQASSLKFSAVDDVEDVDEETVPVKRIRKLLAENRAAKQKAASAEKLRDDDEVPRDEDATELVERGASSQAGAAKRFSANYMVPSPFRLSARVLVLVGVNCRKHSVATCPTLCQCIFSLWTHRVARLL